MTNPRFFIQREGTEAGPYDLVQMASLLRKHIIDGETSTRLEGDDAWKPFSWQPQFSVVREMSPDATSMRLDELNEEALDRQSPIPLPSRETVLKLVALLVGTLLAGVGSFLLSLTSATLGHVLLIGGIGAVMVATCLMYARVMDEDGWTLASIVFIPYYDIYYLLTNIWKYFDLICAKYIGAAVAIGAALALGMGLNSH